MAKKKGQEEQGDQIDPVDQAEQAALAEQVAQVERKQRHLMAAMVSEKMSLGLTRAQAVEVANAQV